MAHDALRELQLNELSYNVQAFNQHIEAASNECEQDYLRSLQTGFLDASSHPSAPYAPRLLYNDKVAAENVLSSLEVDSRSATGSTFRWHLLPRTV